MVSAKNKLYIRSNGTIITNNKLIAIIMSINS